MTAMMTLDQLKWLEVYSQDGRKLGRIKEIYYDGDTEACEWVAVKAGFLGMKRMLVPLEGAEIAGDELHLAFTSRELAGVPPVDESQFLSDDDEAFMFSSFGLTYPGRSFGYQGGTYLAGGVPVNDMPQEIRSVPGHSAVGTEQRVVRGGSVRLRRWINPERQ